MFFKNKCEKVTFVLTFYAIFVTFVANKGIKMLIDFSVSNFSSFKDKVTLSMEKTPIQKHKEHIFNGNLLSGVGIYGANASGKTNLLQTIKVLSEFTSIGDRDVVAFINSNKFMLDNNKPVKFEVNFISNGFKYNYKIAISKDEISNEELYFSEKNKQNLVFKRTGVEKEFGKLFADNFYKNCSFARNRTLLSKLIIDGIVDNDVKNKQHIANVVNFLRGIGFFDPKTQINPLYVYHNFKFPEFKKFLLDLLVQADFGITDISFKELEVPQTVVMRLDIGALTRGEVLCRQEDEDYYFFSLEKGKIICRQLVMFHGNAQFPTNRESAGTIKLFKLAFMLYSFKKTEGSKILLLDEFDSLFHPFLSKMLLKSLLNNPMGGQIIAVLHNTLLLSHDIWRVDEIWFTEKDSDGSTRLYPLIDINPRFDKSLERDYINGRYGAVPFLGGEQVWQDIIK